MERGDKEALWMIAERNGIAWTIVELERYKAAKKEHEDDEAFEAYMEERI